MERVNDDDAKFLLHMASRHAMNSGWGPNCVRGYIEIHLDLMDARQEVKRLKKLSDSQAEALEMMERGSLK